MTTGASSILANLRKRIPQDSFSQETALSSMMSNIQLSSYLPPRHGVAIAAFKVASVDPNTNSIIDGINRLFGGELNAVEGSLKVLEKSKFYTSVSAHLMRNTITRPIVGDKAPAGFITLSKNIFMEERDSKTWKLVTTDEGRKILVRDNSVETDDDIQKLLSSLSSVGHQYTNEAKRVVSLAGNLLSSLNTGVLVSFVSHSNVHELGFIVNPIDQQDYVGIVSVTGDEAPNYATVPATSVIHSFDIGQYASDLHLPRMEATASKSFDVNFLVDYYKKVYGYNTDYFQRFLEKIKSNGVV